MTLTRKSGVLLAVTAVLMALNLLDLRNGEAVAPTLPSLPVIAVEAVTRLTIGDQINLLTIERASADAPWKIVAPLQYPADAQVVAGFIKALSGGVPMDTRIDEGRLEEYGVDDQHALRAEIYTDGTTPAVALVVGKTAGPDSSFVRLPGSNVVYRAAVGPRTRFERAAGDWRDKSVIAVDPTAVKGLSLERGAESIRFLRSEAAPQAWSLTDAPFAIDPESVETLAKALSRIRAGEIHDSSYEAGWEAPAATATLTLADGSVHRLVLGSKQDERSAWIRVDERPEVFRVAAKVRAALTVPLADLRDRRLATLDPLAIDTATWAEGSITTTVRWDPDSPKWVVVQPENTALDQRSIVAATGALAQLRAAGFAPDATFTPSGTFARLVMRDGTRWQIDLAAAEGASVRAKVTGRGELFLLDAQLVSQLRAAFGR